MRLPEPAPDWRTALARAIDRLVPLSTDENVRAAVDRINAAYLPWEKVRFLPRPADLSSEEIWALVKLRRTQNYRTLPLRSESGTPFSWWLPDEALRELHVIDQQAGGVLGAGSSVLPEDGRNRYLVSSLMEEAIASSRIEGAATTRKAAKEMLRTARSPRTKAERMIVNNYRAIRRIGEVREQPLTEELLHELHALLTEGTLDEPSTAGRYRTAADRVVVADDRDGEILYVPPPAGQLRERMERFLAFANDRSDEPFIHPVVRAILLHFWLAVEHPYVDGNGRTARAVFYWYMLARGYWLFEYLSISRIILNSSIQYGRAYLNAERDDGDATYFLMYHLRAIRLAVKDLHLFLEKKRRDMGKALRLLRGVRLNGRQQALLQHALKHPDGLYTIESHRISHGVVRATAAADLEEMAKRGYLVRGKTGRKYAYLPAEGLAEGLAERLALPAE